MKEIKFYSAGFYLIEETTRYNSLDKNILPLKIYSFSNCICKTFPGSWAYQWNSKLINEAKLISQEYNINENTIENLKKEINNIFEIKIGWPGVFFNKNTARDFYRNYFSNIKNIKLLEVGIEQDNWNDILIIFENDKNGLIMKLKEKVEIDNTGEIIGYDVVGYDCGLACSFLCNGLENDYINKFGFKLNKYGLFDDYTKAITASDYNMRDDVPCEPVLWKPWIVCEHII